MSADYETTPQPVSVDDVDGMEGPGWSNRDLLRIETNEAVPLQVQEVEPSQPRVSNRINKGQSNKFKNYMTMGVKSGSPKNYKISPPALETITNGRSLMLSKSIHRQKTFLNS